MESTFLPKWHCRQPPEKSKRNPPPVPELKPFEEDVTRMLENIQFRKVNNQFTASLENDILKVKSSPNVYETDTSTYNKLLSENITKTYKLAQDGTVDSIKGELKTIANDLKIKKHIEPMAQTQSFITLKDHKEDFENHPKCRLINPAKSDLGKVSKTILDKINLELRNQTCTNQWCNSDETIAWFKSVGNKDRYTFLSFDIIDFYQSISEDLLDNTISWAKPFTTILDTDMRVIKHATKSLLLTTAKRQQKEAAR